MIYVLIYSIRFAVPATAPIVVRAEETSGEEEHDEDAEDNEGKCAPWICKHEVLQRRELCVQILHIHISQNTLEAMR